MRKHIITTALAAAVSALAFGQNLNPTVEVTNAYAGGASSINKPVQQMAVPDSVLKFNLDFDYSVFEKPYQGAYEFKPYYVQLRPAPAPSEENWLYVRLGAGYTLHPELDIVYTPLRKERYQVNVHAGHHSFFGRYHQFGAAQLDEVDTFAFKPTGEKVSGFLTDTQVGVDGTYAWSTGQATLDLSYVHRMADDNVLFRKMGGVRALGRVRSLPAEGPHFLYDATLDYSLVGDDTSFGGEYASAVVIPSFSSRPASVRESRFAFDGSFGPVFENGNRLLVDLDLDLVRYMGDLTGYTGLLSVTPHYDFSVDNWRFNLGAAVSTFIYSEDWTGPRPKSGYIFPAVYVDFNLLEDQLILQASATGGDQVISRSRQFMERPFSELSDYGNGRIRARLMGGARGHVASFLRYDLQAGVTRCSRMPMDAFGKLVPYTPITSSSDYTVPLYIPTLQEASYYLFFAELNYGVKWQSLTVDGNVAWKHAKITEPYVFAPADLTGSLRPTWHWGSRFSAGLDAGWSTRRKATVEDSVYFVPGWIDLGLHADLQFTQHMGFWVKAGNLLCQAIQRTPLHAEAGLYLTAGLLLTF